jgi:hypothetical protein
MVWKADVVQGVLFTVPSERQIDALDAWQTAFKGESPEGFRRPPNPILPSHAEGASAGVRITITSLLGRLDVVATPPAPTAVIKDRSQIEDLVGTTEEVTRILLALTDKVKIVRAGLVGNLSQSVGNEQAVAARLTEVTGAWFPSPALDALYQVNVRRSYENLGRYEMNRVLTWSAGVYQVLTGQIGISPPVLQQSTPIVSLRIDVNSAPADGISEYVKLIMADNRNELLLLCEQGMERVR